MMVVKSIYYINLKYIHVDTHERMKMNRVE